MSQEFGSFLNKPFELLHDRGLYGKSFTFAVLEMQPVLTYSLKILIKA